MPFDHERETELTPPQAIEAEQAVLGSVMIDPDAFNRCGVLSDNDFYHARHRIIWRAIRELRDEAKPTDAVTLGEWLESNNLSEQIGGSGYLIELASTTPSAANVSSYADIVRDRAVLRHLVEAGTDVVNAGLKPNGSSATDVFLKSVARITSVGDRIAHATVRPVNLFDVAAPPALRPEWLPPAIADFVMQYSEVKGSPVEVLALCSLVSCSAAIHDNFKIQPRPHEPGWLESARLWGMIVGDPSAMKSPPLKLATNPLVEMNVQLVQKFKQEFTDYNRAMDEWKIHDKKRRKAIADGDGLPDDVPAPERPANRRIVINDATMEKLADLLSDNPRGLLYINDELAGWFASMDIYSKGGNSGRDRSYWLRFYDGGGMVIDRVSRETTIIPNASMRVLGAIQPERIRAMASKMDDDGLLQRFIVAMIPTAQRFPADKPEPQHLKLQYNDLLTHIYNTNPADGISVVRMEPGAFAIQNELMADIRALVGTEGLPPMLRSHLAKWPGLFPRLCLTYHVIACAASRKFPTTYPVAESTARRVAELMRGWMLPSAITFYTGLIGHANPAYDLSKQIANMILGRGMSRISNRDLTMALHSWRSAPDYRQRAAMTQLEQAGWLLAPNREPGERKDAWPVNPAVHTEFATRAARIQTERANINRILANARQGKTAAAPEFRDPADDAGA